MRLYTAICTGLLGGLLLFTPAFIGCTEKGEADMAAAADSGAGAADGAGVAAPGSQAAPTGAAPTLEETKSIVAQASDIIEDVAAVLRRVETVEDFNAVEKELKGLSDRADALDAKMTAFQENPDPQIREQLQGTPEFIEFQTNLEAMMTEVNRISADPRLAEKFKELMPTAAPPSEGGR